MSKAGAPVPDRGPLLAVVSGPSGVGKDSILGGLGKRDRSLYVASTATTRPQREARPVDHPFLDFLSRQQFEEMLTEDGFLEHAEVYGHLYGSPKAPIAKALSSGKDVVLRVDTQGAETIKKLVPQAVLIFIAPPSVAELGKRLRSRGMDDAKSVEQRLEAAERELAEVAKFDYAVVNRRDRLEEAIDEVRAIITAERCRIDREPASL